MRPWLTSDAHPLRIDAVAAPGAPGLIGMTLCPGKKDPYATYGAWDRDLEADLLAIRAWGAATIVSLLEDHEFELLGLTDFETRVTQAFRWHWLPIADGGAPDQAFEEMWRVDGPDLRGRLVAGERVLIHCRAGLGRTGLVASWLLVELGMTPTDAIHAVRRARPGTVETTAQERYVLQLTRRAEVSGTQGPSP